MRILNSVDLEKLYLNARAGFTNCIKDDENTFLDAEIGMSRNELIVKNEWIKIQFFETDENHYIIETRLGLYSQTSDKLGHYSRHDDENGDFVDEYLVFE